MILITGASKGVGEFLFEKFQQNNSEVIGTYNTTFKKGELNNSMFQVDVSDFRQVENWIAGIEGRLNNIVLLNCAGINYNSFAHKAEIEKWNRVLEVNLMGTFNVIRSVLPYMRKQKYGRIINFSSVTAQMGTMGISAYAASKSGLWGMTRSIAVENGSLGITINNINLGYANIGMGINALTENFSETIKSRIPSKEFCPPEDIFSTVQFLINTGYITGTSIDLNGGLI